MNKPGFLSKNENSITVLDYICATLLALVPILQHYKGPVYNAALTVAVGLVPYLLVRAFFIVRKMSIKQVFVQTSPVLIMVVYFLYRIIDHGTTVTEFGQCGVLIVYLLAAALGCVKGRQMCRSAVVICMIASVGLVVQYVGFYLFEHHVQMVPTDWLLPTAEQWILGAQTGLAGITGRLNDFYRPSAFFLEPSHLYIYAFPQLFLVLFGSKTTIRRLVIAIIISLGMILSTSGMGMAVVAGAWLLYFALYDEKTGTFAISNVLRRRNLVLMGSLVIVAFLAYLVVPSVQRTVNRIFATKSGTTAISGRIARALQGLEGMNVWQWIFGKQDNTHGTAYNVPGLIGALIRHGLIGMVLSVELYVVALFKDRLPYKLVAAIILVTSVFSAHTHSTVGMLYYMLILLSGYGALQKEKVSD